MKKITEETLNAIQENVRTRETQELGYKRDNLFKGSWKDFEIKDLKPNLIPNSWDSFEPYGSGTNYVENWNFESSFLYFNTDAISQSIKDNILHIQSTGTKDTTAIYKQNIGLKGAFVFRLKIKGNGRTRFGSQLRPTDLSKIFELDDDWKIIEHTMELNEDSQIGLYLLERDGEAQIDWVQITPVDNQHLVVEKTPLENGLTRIQTWGGNNNIKLRNYAPIDPKKIGNVSFYVNNKENNFIFQIDAPNAFTIIKGFNGFFIRTLIKGEGSDRNAIVRVNNINDNLDFIASDPQIVEGDVPNPTMIVTPLSDGREHVQVYGATKDTKLVYSGDEGFVGENYGLKTTIENNGIDLDLSTSLTEEKKRIEKGENKVNLQGELSTKLSVEIGVPSE